ncbi:MAG: hypothetical protein WCI20_12585 [bacterium]
MRQCVRATVAGLIMTGSSVVVEAQTASSQVASNAPSTAVLATLRVTGKDYMDVAVTSFDGVKLFYRDPTMASGASISLAAASLDRFSFDIKMDADDVNRALMEQNWNRACILLWPVVSPLFPYLGIKNNNGVDLAMTLGNALVKTANLMRAEKGGDEEKANRITQRAFSVYTSLAAAEWFPEAESARMRSILCLITLKNLKQAEAELKKLRVPEIGDQTMGLYWFTLAALREANGDNRGAMNAVVKSVAFENKDIEVFPEALMMSGRLYEALLEPYRARDVYYEVARLFQGTDWANLAKTRLQYVMNQKLTLAKEVVGIERTFFGLDEDVNAKAMSLLKGTLDVEKPEAEESLDPESETGKPKAQGTGGEEEAAPPPPAPMPAPAPISKPAPASKPAKKGTSARGNSN